MFPDEIRNNMIAFDNGDYLRLPTYSEIFGNRRRYKIACAGYMSNRPREYWLCDRQLNNNKYIGSVLFYGVSEAGTEMVTSGFKPCGVRLVFCIKKSFIDKGLFQNPCKLSKSLLSQRAVSIKST